MYIRFSFPLSMISFFKDLGYHFYSWKSQIRSFRTGNDLVAREYLLLPHRYTEKAEEGLLDLKRASIIEGTSFCVRLCCCLVLLVVPRRQACTPYIAMRRASFKVLYIRARFTHLKVTAISHKNMKLRHDCVKPNRSSIAQVHRGYQK